LNGLNGISDETLEMHFKLYEGYVKETNNLTEKISEFLADGKVDQEEMPAYPELTRRLGFEYNGMVLLNTTSATSNVGTLVIVLVSHF
jgi:superoxide dismutase, Fe-Mn family